MYLTLISCKLEIHKFKMYSHTFDTMEYLFGISFSNSCMALTDSNLKRNEFNPIFL